MARKSQPSVASEKATDGSKSSGYDQFEFLNIELDKEQKEKLKAMPFWNSDWDGQLALLEQSGFQISLKIDGFNHCFAAYMQIRLHSHPCYGFILAGRGSTPTKALRQLIFKHFVVLKENWSGAVGAQIAQYDD
jgi:hypothetical protein